jgi:transketolase N-terminal domain/subunit
MTAATFPTTFPIDLSAYQRISLDPSVPTLTDEQRSALKANIDLCRDAIVFFTATGAARGVGGHTGGPFDTVPEVVILDALFRGGPDQFVPIFFDEAGHRVATQYLMATLNGELPAEQLMRYRAAHEKLPGHPELGLTPGVKFSSGRLGHMWPYVNGVALANPGKTAFCLGSDGSQQEGNDAEAARFAVANHVNVKLLIDDNDVTIAGHPSQYMGGYSVKQTLEGHGLTVLEGDGEDLDSLYANICQAINTPGPIAIVNKRPMSVGIDGIEGSTHGHDVIPVDAALKYLEAKGHTAAVDILKGIEKPKNTYTFLGASDKLGSNRNVFGRPWWKCWGPWTRPPAKTASWWWTVIWRAPVVWPKSARPIPKSSSAAAFKSGATCQRRRALAWKRASKGSSPPSAPFWKCAFPKSPWPG